MSRRIGSSSLRGSNSSAQGEGLKMFVIGNQFSGRPGEYMLFGGVRGLLKAAATRAIADVKGNTMDGSARRPMMRNCWRLAFAVAWPVALLGCDAPFPGAPGVKIKAPVAKKEAPVAKKEAPRGCRVDGRIVSTEWKELDGGIERAIVSAWKLPEKVRVEDVNAEGERFELHLPPGDYRLDYSAVGTLGATFKGLSREVSIAKNQDQLDVGQIDLPISKSTALYGKPAPELAGIIDWKDTPALALKDLHGKVVVLDFFAYYCSICHAHKPDLAKLGDSYGRRGLVVLAIHEASLGTMDEVNAKMDPVLHHVFDGVPPKLPMALDGKGEQSVFEAYGIYAVPAVILIDQQGRVVRRYHHAGVPQLEADVRRLLSVDSKPGR